jgi:hypothetical protein
MRHRIWFAVAILMLIDAVGYTLGAIGPIRRGLNPTEPYWQRRLLLNLMLANQGLYLGAAIALVDAVIEAQQRGAASALFGLALATCVYTLVTVPLFTPRDTAHVIPRVLAAMLIIIGFTVNWPPGPAPGIDISRHVLGGWVLRNSRTVSGAREKPCKCLLNFGGKGGNRTLDTGIMSRPILA